MATKQKTTARLLAEEVCSKFKDTPSLTLAKKLFTENPEVYTTEEHARTIIRTIRGKIGAKNKKELADKSLVDTKPRPLNPFDKTIQRNSTHRNSQVLRSTNFLPSFRVRR